jgi:hypothetical protein
MDKIGFKIEKDKKQEYSILGIYVNNKNLIDILRNYEKQFNEKSLEIMMKLEYIFLLRHSY